MLFSTLDKILSYLTLERLALGGGFGESRIDYESVCAVLLNRRGVTAMPDRARATWTVPDGSVAWFDGDQIAEVHQIFTDAYVIVFSEPDSNGQYVWTTCNGTMLETLNVDDLTV